MKRIVLLIALLTLTGCKSRTDGDEASSPSATADEQTLQAAAEPDPAALRGSPLLAVLTAAEGLDADKADLGNRLYHDTRLSVDGTLSCASCHNINAGGDDDRAGSLGVGGQVGPISSPTTLNSDLNFVQFWDGRAATLEEQAAGPVANPIEMGHQWPDVVASLSAVPAYVADFQRIYNGPVSEENATDAIAEFERSLRTPGPFDAWLEGDDSAMSDEAVNGLQRFVDVGCTACHNGAGLGGSSYQNMGAAQDYFALRGGEITEVDLGRFNVTGDEADRHSFKVPLLRNIALTGPYFHDGSAETLDEAVLVMAQVQLAAELSDEDVAAMVAFLEALTGPVPVQPLEPYAL